jgi:hypothetical protein
MAVGLVGDMFTLPLKNRRKDWGLVSDYLYPQSKQTRDDIEVLD